MASIQSQSSNDPTLGSRDGQGRSGNATNESRRESAVDQGREASMTTSVTHSSHAGHDTTTGYHVLKVESRTSVSGVVQDEAVDQGDQTDAAHTIPVGPDDVAHLVAFAGGDMVSILGPSLAVMHATELAFDFAQVTTASRYDGFNVDVETVMGNAGITQTTRLIKKSDTYPRHIPAAPGHHNPPRHATY